MLYYSGYRKVRVFLTNRLLFESANLAEGGFCNGCSGDDSDCFGGSVALIVVVLMQSGKEAGLSAAISGASESYLSKNKKGGLDHTLAVSTKWIAIVWVLLTLVLSFM